MTRDKFMKELHVRNIGLGVHYRAIPVHPVYQRLFGWKPENFPNAIMIGQTTLSLPLSAKLTDEDADDVIAAVKDVLQATSFEIRRSTMRVLRALDICLPVSQNWIYPQIKEVAGVQPAVLCGQRRNHDLFPLHSIPVFQGPSSEDR